MALTPRQRRSIDRAFDRATRPKSEAGPSRKRRKLDSPPPDDFGAGGGGGGFMDVDIDDQGEGEGGFMDAGGYIPDDDGGGGGGFVPSDEDDGGGFIPDSPNHNAQPEPATKTKREGRRLPIRLLPAILSSLNLPSDEDVLSVFRSSASGWDDPSLPTTRRRRGDDDDDEVVDLSVGLKDFRAVCAALMGPDEGPEGPEDEDGEDLSDPESVYEEEGDGDGDGSSLSDLSEDEYQDPAFTSSTSKGKGIPAKGKGNGKGKGKGRGKKNADLEERGKVKLNSRQKEIVNDLWTMIKPPPPAAEGQQQQKSWGILGRDELRKRVRELGEMWTEDEVSHPHLHPSSQSPPQLQSSPRHPTIQIREIDGDSEIEIEDR